jgi:5-methylthioribose kinase
MLELTPDNAIDFLRSRHWVGPGPVCVEPLGWGVSNLVLRVQSLEQSFVLKQSRPQLRTRDPWFSDLERVYREQEVMETLFPLLPPPTVPEVLFSDPANFVFCMSLAPAAARVWKEELLSGRVDQQLGERAGTILGRMHQATAGRQDLADRFGKRTVFVQLRVDPFYRRIQARRPEVADAVGRIVTRMLEKRDALCHGDFSPKNLLCHDQGFTLVDYETAHYGDPTMDLGFFLSHLILKAVKHHADRDRYIELTRSFWRGYQSTLGLLLRRETIAEAIGHFAVCALARIDGTSPVDYLPEGIKRDLVRDLARTILTQPPLDWEEVLQQADARLARLQ